MQEVNTDFIKNDNGTVKIKKVHPLRTELNYYFNVAIAQLYGVDEAIMINNFIHWDAQNKANNTNFHDGRYWTYNSKRAYTELFPFWTEKQIRRILESLLDKGIIIKGNYNKLAYDHTNWYSLNLETICPNGPIDLTKQSNRLDQMGQPIPYLNPYLKPNHKQEDSQFNKLNNESNKSDEINSSYNSNPKEEKKSSAKRKEEINYKPIYELYPSKCPFSGSITHRSNFDKKKMNMLINDLGIDEVKEIIIMYVESCKQSKRYLKNFKTLINTFPERSDFIEYKQQETQFKPMDEVFKDGKPI